MNKVVVAVVAVLGFAVAGCGSSGGSGRPASSSHAGSAAAASGSAASISAGPSGSAVPVGAPRDKTALGKVVVQQSDLPAGWTATPHQADPSDAAEQAAFIRCAGGRNTEPDKVAEVDSPDFGQNDASISSSATSFKNQADVAADVALLKSRKVSPCYGQLGKAQLARSLPSGAKLDALSITITPGPGSGPSNVAGIGKGTVTVSVSGQQLVVSLSIAFITGPLTEAEIDIESPGRPIPDSLFTSLMRAVAARAAHA